MDDDLMPKDIRGIFNVRYDNKTMVYHEAKGYIPPPQKKTVGILKNVSCWTTEQLPEIGKFYGSLNKAEDQIVIAVYMGKGGVLKTTLSYNLARSLAICGMRVLIIGLDTQVSMTTLALKPEQYFDLKTLVECEGLYEFISKGKSLGSLIKKTDLPTMDVLPETSNLSNLETSMKLQSPREKFFKNNLLTDKAIKAYDAVIFDLAPGFDVVTENALYASENLIIPMSTEIGTAQASIQNVKKIRAFQARMKKNFKSISIVPTLVTNTKLSRQLLGMYENKFGKEVINHSIRRSISAQESLIKKKSAIEYDHACDLAEDLRTVIEELWNERINPKVH